MRGRHASIPRPVLAGLLVFVMAFAFFSFSTGPLTGYEPETGAVAAGLVLEGQLHGIENSSLPLQADIPGRGGHRYARTGLPQPLLEAPFFAVGHFADTTFGHFGAYPNGYAFLWFYNPFMAALAAVALFALVFMARRSLRWATTIAFLFTVASIALPYSKIGMETTYLALILGAFALGFWARSSPSALSWALTGLATGAAMATKPYALISVAPIAVLLWPAFAAAGRSRRWRLLAAGATPVLLWIIAIAWYNHYRFGGITDFGYTESSLTLSMPLNFLGLLFSPGKGLILYSPLVVIGALGMPRLWRADRWLAAALLLFFLSLTAVAAASTYWGDEVWGPRYIVPAAWTLLVPIAWWAEGRTRRRVLAGAASLAILVQVVGIAVSYAQFLPVVRTLTGVPILRDREGAPLSRIPYGDDGFRWVPELSPLLLQTEGLLSTTVIEPLGGDLTITYAPFEGEAHSVDFSDPKLRMPLDFWWSAAPRYRGLACLLAFLILLVAGGAGVALYRVSFGRKWPWGPAPPAAAA
jgi:hypothetical protein